MTHYTCGHCGHKFWRAGTRKPGQYIMCPSCKKMAFRFAKPLKLIAPPQVRQVKLEEVEGAGE